jgi:hypothetical protein
MPLLSIYTSCEQHDHHLSEFAKLRGGTQELLPRSSHGSGKAGGADIIYRNMRTAHQIKRRARQPYETIFQAIPRAGGDMVAVYQHPEIARLCRDLKLAMDRLPRRRRAAIVTDHLAWFRVPVWKTK